MVRETTEIGVLVERRVLDNPWIDHVWAPVAALAGAPAAAPWTVLSETPRATRYYAGAFRLEFFGSDTTMYRENLRSGRPSLWVSLRRADAPPGVVLHLVTADPAEAEALTEPGTDVIDTVAMPLEIQARLAAFVEAHHVERPFVKRKRDRADPEAMARRAPADTRKTR
jgi:Protein of unknown function (DUF3305)